MVHLSAVAGGEGPADSVLASWCKRLAGVVSPCDLHARVDSPYDFLDMPVPPWGEDEGLGEQSLVDSDATPLQEVVLRFGLTLPTAGGAEAFARLFGFMYKRSGVTARDNVAWLTSCAPPQTPAMPRYRPRSQSRRLASTRGCWAASDRSSRISMTCS